MNHALARLKKASTISSGSHASSSQPSSGVDGHGNLLPSYSPGQRGQGAPLPMAEKTLPPGAAAYSHPSTRWDQAQRERDELERAIKLSEEQDQYEAALRASQEAEEAEALRKQQELEAEDAVLRESMAEHESHEDQLAIIQAEEEQAILAAIRESEREAANAQPRTAAKGKQTRRSSSRLAGPTINSGDSPLIEEGEDDEDLRKAMQLSMLDQEDERQQQEAMFEQAQRQRQASSSAQASTSALSPHRSSPSPSTTSAATSNAARPPPPHLLPPRPNQVQTPSSGRNNGPTLPPRRRLSEDSEYQSISEAPPPAYEAASSSAPTAPSSSQQSHGQSQTSPAPSDSDAGTWQTARSTTETAQEEARALEEKRQVFYPPVATSEMAEGSMRAFVPHMLFAARRRERSDPDEWLPMASRDVDLSQLAAGPQSPSTPNTSPQTRQIPASRPRRPLPPLPTQAGSAPQAQAQFSALAQLDQKVASISPTSPTSPSYYTASIPPSNASFAAPSTTQAVENENYNENDDAEDDDDPFDDSRAALTDEEYTGPGSDTEDYYNDHPSHTIHQQDLQNNYDSSERDSQVNNISHATSTADHSESAETSPPVERHDYARTRSNDNTTHLPRAHSPKPMTPPQIVNAEQQDLAAGEGYMSGESAVSWESTGSEDDEPRPQHAALNESAQDINTNISFGFNPLSSPNAHLDWQGRFPDLIVLSRFADQDPRHATPRDEGTSMSQSKDDYRTFAFEAPTWRELLAYLMWHGNSIFEAASRDKETSTPDTLKVSLILEFVKTANPPSTLVRLQIHLLSTSADTQAQGQTSGARGVALSRQPLSSRPANYIRSSLPWQQPTNKDSTHLVLAFPKPYHTLPFTLGTIGTHLHNAHKAAVAQHTQQTDHRIQLGDKGRIHNTQFLTDLLRGVELCTDKTMDNQPGRYKSASGSQHQAGTAAGGHASPDDSRFERLVGRLKEKRHNMRGTLRELHKNSRSRRRRKQQAKDKGKGNLDGRAEDSDESYLDSQPRAEDYHITPYPANS